MKPIEEILAGYPFFKELSESDRKLLSNCARFDRYESSQYIFREGEAAEWFYLILEGQVTLESFIPGSGPVTVVTLGPGEILGWSWLFPPYRWHFDAQAVNALRMATFDAACIHQKCQDDPRLGFEVMQYFARIIIQRLQAARLQTLEILEDIPVGS